MKTISRRDEGGETWRLRVFRRKSAPISIESLISEAVRGRDDNPSFIARKWITLLYVISFCRGEDRVKVKDDGCTFRPRQNDPTKRIFWEVYPFLFLKERGSRQLQKYIKVVFTWFFSFICN